jgi:transcription-repair coupling factor (superfamily II helicase)
MDRTVADLKELVPEAEINFGHGQMGELQLERVMQDFYHQRFNILVASTIIESGIDVPSANTMIINRADRFGLAQLHQLRGRVGRSHHQAYAYLLVPDLKTITNDAKKRLDAIDSMEDLGAGFTLASHDLEIRGAGELLGETQSGSIDDVGFSLYSEYLSQAVRSIRENRIPSDTDPGETASTIELHVPALFPESYLGNTHTRLVMYKRIASAQNLEELEELQIETIDRFGLLPDAGKNLFRLTAMRLQAERIGIHKMDIGTEGGTVDFREQVNVDPSVILGLIQNDPSRHQLAGPGSLRLKGDLEEHEIRIRTCEKLLDTLASNLGEAA